MLKASENLILALQALPPVALVGDEGEEYQALTRADRAEAYSAARKLKTAAIAAAIAAGRTEAAAIVAAENEIRHQYGLVLVEQLLNNPDPYSETAAFVARKLKNEFYVTCVQDDHGMWQVVK